MIRLFKCFFFLFFLFALLGGGGTQCWFHGSLLIHLLCTRHNLLQNGEKMKRGKKEIFDGSHKDTLSCIHYQRTKNHFPIVSIQHFRDICSLILSRVLFLLWRTIQNRNNNLKDGMARADTVALPRRKKDQRPRKCFSQLSHGIKNVYFLHCHS